MRSSVSSLVITGEVLTNDTNVSGFSKRTGDVKAKVVVTRNDKVIFEKVISANYIFESSFIGVIVILNGQANYVQLIQKSTKNHLQMTFSYLHKNAKCI